jgi:hypothetical protein
VDLSLILHDQRRLTPPSNQTNTRMGGEDKVAMTRNCGERRLGPWKELEGAGGGRQRCKRIVTTPAEERASRAHKKNEIN